MPPGARQRRGIWPRIWHACTEPSAQIQDSERRRQARSLSVLLLLSLALAVLAVGLTYSPVGPTSMLERGLGLRVELAAFALFAGIYALSRTRFSILAATLTVAVFLASTFSAAIFEPSAPAVLTYVILGGLVSSLFLSPRVTAFIFGITCVGLQALYYPFHRLSAPDLSRAVFLTVIVGIFVVVATAVREHYLHQIEKQAQILGERGERLIAALRSSNEINQKLQSSMKELEEVNRETVTLAGLGGLLQACTTVAESYHVIGNVAPRLFPRFSGALFAYGPSRDGLEAVVSWGSIPEIVQNRIFEPEKCWALRLGRPQKNDGLCAGTPCALVAGACSSLCVPMIAHGEALGILFLRDNESGGVQKEVGGTSEALAVMAAEHVAMALANLGLQATLRLQSMHDPLTGLYNRRFMHETLDRDIRRAGRSGRPVSIIMSDLDHFKHFNDGYGHEAGDLLLHRLGEFLQESIRGGDIACRYGGEEFVVILPETPLDDARRRADEIRDGVKRLTVALHGRSLGTITSSFGVAVFPTHATEVGALLRAADQALYRAKAEGRDRVVLAEATTTRSVEQSTTTTPEHDSKPKI